MDGGDDGWGSVEGVKRGPLGTGVFLSREQSFKLLAEGLPGGIFEAAAYGVGEDGKGHRAEAREACEHPPFLVGRLPQLVVDFLDHTDGGEDVAGLGFFTAGDGEGRCR